MGIQAELVRVARAALEEDLGEAGLAGDVTTTSTVAPSLWGEASIVAGVPGVVCGLGALDATFGLLDSRVGVSPKKVDGDELSPGEVVAVLEGPVRALLTGERSALTLLMHLSGVATLTREFVRRAPGVELTETRKTLAGLRALQKYAVTKGGGKNHRMSLRDGVLIKDNHVVAAGSIGEAVRRAKASTTLPVQAECDNARQVEEALAAGADAILLDNHTPARLRRAVRRIAGRAFVEASGGITLRNVSAIAASGVDRISVGALTHSAPALDFSFELTRTWDAPGR